jgi:prepilin-type N-terminal cleavage/methylation domain-containing protein
MHLQSNKRAGFTLVEMMMVVTIIGILAALAIPKYVAYLNRSKSTDRRARPLD